jgi:hypothetical protein
MSSGSFSSSLAGSQLGGPQSDFVIVEWTDAGDSGYEWIAPLHVHHADDEAWYVLEGGLRFAIGDEIREAGPHGAGDYAAIFRAHDSELLS